MKYANSIVDLIGNTPLVKLSKVTDNIAATVLVKLEYMNPGGSVKDRIALGLLAEAEKSGQLSAGGTVVEPTSGNTGVGLALVAQQRGYDCVFVVPDKVAQDKQDVLSAYGARVVVTPTAVAPDSPESYYSVADKITAETPGAYKPDQFSNPGGPLSHYASTGPEIWADTDAQITHFVAGIGTGGTITGTGRYLKEVSAARESGSVQIIGADPAGSVYSGGDGRPYFVEGVGEDMWPEAYDPSVPDEVIAVTDAESFAMTRRLAREEGILVGGSSGMAVVAGLKAAEQLSEDDVMVILLPDSGRGYLSKIFSDSWMDTYGFATDSRDDAEPESTPIAQVLAAKTGSLPEIVFASPTESIADAVERMKRYDLSALPVLSHELPARMGEVLGSLTEREISDKLLSGSAQLSHHVGMHIQPRLPVIGIGADMEALRRIFSASEAAMVTEDGEPIGIITRQDLLTSMGKDQQVAKNDGKDVH